MLRRKSRFDAAFSARDGHGLRPSQDVFPASMKLHSPATAGFNAITAYDERSIAVSGRALTRSFIVTPERLIEDWAPTSAESLTEADLAVLAELGCDVILLGTGARQKFPAPALLRPLITRQIGVEVMDSHAACRTYNILMAEGRAVAAALIIEA